MAPIAFVSVVLLAGVSVSSFAATGAATDPAASVCRKVIDAKDPNGKVYCGKQEQWVEFDRRAALVNAGVTCRNARTAYERCYTDTQWKQYDKKRQLLAGTSMSLEPTHGASIGEYSGAAMEAQQNALMQHQALTYVPVVVPQVPSGQ